MRLAYFKNRILYESNVILVKDIDEYFYDLRYTNLDGKRNIYIGGNTTRLFRDNTNTIKTKEDLINELKRISNLDIVDYSNLLKLITSTEAINNSKLYDVLREFILLYNYQDMKVCSHFELGQLLRMTIKNRQDYSSITKYATTADPNTYFLNRLGIESLSYELTNQNKSSKMKL